MRSSLRRDDRGIIPALVVLLGLLGLLGFTVISYAFFADLFVVSLLLLFGFVAVWALTQVKSKPAVSGIILVFLVISAGTLAFVFLFALVTVDTTTREFENGGWKGTGAYARSGNSGEIILQRTIITAIDASKDSEVIAFSGALYAQGWTPCVIDAVEYRTALNTGSGWVALKTYYQKITNTAGNYITLTPQQTQLRGTYPSGSGFRVEIWSHCAFSGNPYYKVAKDEVQLLSGWGKATWGADRYQVGEEACFTWDVPFVASEIDPGKGWFIEGFHEGTGAQLFPRVEITTLTGRQCVTVTNEMFQTGAGCNNVLVARLTSELYIQSEDYTTTIDFSELGPDVSNLRSDKSEYEEGETIRLTWNETANTQTGLPIVRVTVSYGAGELNDYDVPPGTEEYEITTGVTGATRTIHVELVIADEGCRPDSEDLDIVVHRKGSTPLPPGLPWGLLLLLVIAMASVVLYVIYSPLKGILRWIGLLVLIGILIAAGYFSGVL